MTDNKPDDPNALQNAQAQALMAHQRETDVRERNEKIREALQSYSDEDRKLMIADALRALGSNLIVS